MPFLIFGLMSVFIGAFITPLLLPFIPFRSFAVKGWLTGVISVFALMKGIELSYYKNMLPLVAAYIFPSCKFIHSASVHRLYNLYKHVRREERTEDSCHCLFDCNSSFSVNINHIQTLAVEGYIKQTQPHKRMFLDEIYS